MTGYTYGTNTRLPKLGMPPNSNNDVIVSISYAAEQDDRDEEQRPDAGDLEHLLEDHRPAVDIAEHPLHVLLIDDRAHLGQRTDDAAHRPAGE